MTKNESDNIDRYLDIHNPKKNLDSNEYRRQLTNNKRSLKKLGYDIKGIFSFSQSKKKRKKKKKEDISEEDEKEEQGANYSDEIIKKMLNNFIKQEKE